MNTYPQMPEKSEYPETTPLSNLVYDRTYAGNNFWGLINEFKSIAYSASMINAKTVAAVPMRLMLKQELGKQSKNWRTRDLGRKLKLSRRDLISGSEYDLIEITSHPRLNLLKNPSSWCNGHEWIIKIVNYLMFTGNSFSRIYRDFWGNPIEIVPQPTQYVRPSVVGGVLNGYYIGTGGQDWVLPRDIIHIKMPNIGDWIDPSGLVMGYAPVQACFESLLANNLGLAYDLRFLRNFGIPNFAVMMDEDLTDDQVRKIHLDYGQHILNAGETSHPLVVGGKGAKIQSLGSNVSPIGQISSGITNAKEQITIEVSNALGVPYSMLNPSVSVAGGQAEQSNRNWIQHTVVPLCQMIEASINDKLFNDLPEMMISFDSHPANSAVDAEEAKQDWSMNAITLNEYRVSMGWEEVPEPKGSMFKAELEKYTANKSEVQSEEN